MDDTEFIARSLGFRTARDQGAIILEGSTWAIPCRGQESQFQQTPIPTDRSTTASG